MAINYITKHGFILGASASNTNRNFNENPFDRLSSGKRINSAADDATGLTLVSKLETALSEKEQAIRNAVDGQGLLHTADAGAAEVSNILNRMRELAIQAANGTKSIAEREALQSEADQLTAEISRIADSTSFIRPTQLSSTPTDSQGGVSTTGQISVTIDGMSANDLQLDGGRVSFLTPQNSHDAIGAIDVALQKVNTVRSDIGASVNRISISIDHLSNAAKNTKNASSRVSDADVENDRMRLTKSQMSQQASIAMLAQGNASKKMMLHLIS